jgi:hypothetical protein
MWSALSDERKGLSFIIAAGLASAVILGSKSRRTRDHILQSQIRDSPNLEGQVLVFIYPRNRVAQLYLQALGSLFVASYDSQGYREPELLYNWRFTANHFVLAPSPLRLTARFFFI